MNKKVKIIMGTCIVLAVILFIWLFPFEQFLRFETAEEALKFDDTANVKNIIKKIELGNFSYIVYEKENKAIETECLVKDGTGWRTSKNRYYIANRANVEFNYSIFSYHQREENLILIASESSQKENFIKNVSDNINTEFKSNSYEYKGVYYTDWIGVIKKYPKDYKIYIDDKIVEL